MKKVTYAGIFVADILVEPISKVTIELDFCSIEC